MTHNELLSDLASHLRATRDRVVWEDMQLGPSGSPRPDIYTIPKSFTKFVPLAYEIKISISDFRRDVTAGKWHSYLQYASGVTFAVPAGLITKADIPVGCGLMVRNGDGWRTLKAPTLKHIETLSRDVWLKLIMGGIWRQVDINNRCHEPRNLNHEYRANKAIMKRYGSELANALADRDQAIARLVNEKTRLETQAASIRKEREEAARSLSLDIERDTSRITECRAELAVALGLPADAAVYQIIGRASSLADRLNENEEIKSLRLHLKRIKEAFEKGLEPAPFVHAGGEIAA